MKNYQISFTQKFEDNNDVHNGLRMPRIPRARLIPEELYNDVERLWWFLFGKKSFPKIIEKTNHNIIAKAELVN